MFGYIVEFYTCEKYMNYTPSIYLFVLFTDFPIYSSIYFLFNHILIYLLFNHLFIYSLISPAICLFISLFIICSTIFMLKDCLI